MIRSADRVDLDVPTVKSFNRSHAVLKYRPNGQAQGDGMTPGTLAPGRQASTTRSTMYKQQTPKITTSKKSGDQPHDLPQEIHTFLSRSSNSLAAPV